MTLKILVVGLGSMGKRRIRNLVKLGYRDILGFDTQKLRRNESSRKYKIKTVKNIGYRECNHTVDFRRVKVDKEFERHLRYTKKDHVYCL